MSQFVCIYRLFGENRKKKKVSTLGAIALKTKNINDNIKKQTQLKENNMHVLFVN